MGDMEMDMESMMGGDAGGKGGPTQGNVDIVVLSNIEQSCRALQQMGMILSKFITYHYISISLILSSLIFPKYF